MREGVESWWRLRQRACYRSKQCQNTAFGSITLGMTKNSRQDWTGIEEEIGLREWAGDKISCPYQGLRKCDEEGRDDAREIGREGVLLEE